MKVNPVKTQGAWLLVVASAILAGCVAPTEQVPVVSEAEMRASLRACDIASIGYGGPSRLYTFTRKDGSQFMTSATGPSYGGGDWMEAEQFFGQIVTEESAGCDEQIMFVIA